MFYLYWVLKKKKKKKYVIQMLNSFHIVVANKCILEILWPDSEVTAHVFISMINFWTFLIS